MKLLYTTIFLLCLASYGHAQAENKSKESFVRVTFTGLHCDGKNGLCALAPSDKHLANASLIHNNDGTLSVFIRRVKINEVETEALFGKPYDEKFRTQPITFRVGKEFTLSVSTQRDLYMTSNKTRIALDSYPIEITQEHFIITLNLQ